MQMYKVFIDNKLVIFSSNESQHAKDSFVTDSTEEVKRVILNLRNMQVTEVQIVCSSPETMWHSLFKRHKKIKAAGGIVCKNDSFLLIHRLGFWDFPKGKLEKGEAAHLGALREVEEECGIHGHRIVVYVDETLHTYQMNGNDYFKSTDWYFMIYDGEETLIPQTEENISEVKWVTLDQLDSFRSKMYPSLLPVLDKAIEIYKNGTVFEMTKLQ